MDSFSVIEKLTKTCSTCKETKPLAEYDKQKLGKFGVRGICNSCRREEYKTVAEDVCRKRREAYTKLKVENPELLKAINAEHSIRYKKERAIKYQENRKNAEFLLKEAKRKREWTANNKERETNKVREWKKRNGLNYYRKNKEWITKNKVAYHKKREAIDPIYKLKIRLRKAINKAIRSNGFSKSSKTAQLLGVDFETAYKTLTNGGTTSISNMELDHIVPCAQANSEMEVIKLQHISNFRLITAEDNQSKKDHWTPEGGELCLSLLGRPWIDKP